MQYRNNMSAVPDVAEAIRLRNNQYRFPTYEAVRADNVTTNVVALNNNGDPMDAPYVRQDFTTDNLNLNIAGGVQPMGDFTEGNVQLSVNVTNTLGAFAGDAGTISSIPSSEFNTEYEYSFSDIYDYYDDQYSLADDMAAAENNPFFTSRLLLICNYTNSKGMLRHQIYFADSYNDLLPFLMDFMNNGHLRLKSPTLARQTTWKTHTNSIFQTHSQNLIANGMDFREILLHPDNGHRPFRSIETGSREAHKGSFHTVREGNESPAGYYIVVHLL